MWIMDKMYQFIQESIKIILNAKLVIFYIYRMFGNKWKKFRIKERF